jgi:ParB family chromosome partitioning protein
LGAPDAGRSADHGKGGRPPGRRGSPGDRPAAVHELEGLLSEQLDTRVSIELSARRSKVIIEFADLDDLERIYRRLTSMDG